MSVSRFTAAVKHNERLIGSAGGSMLGRGLLMAGEQATAFLVTADGSSPRGVGRGLGKQIPERRAYPLSRLFAWCRDAG